MSIDGSTIVIGAYADDDKGSASGSAYVFTRETPGDLASGWTQLAKLTADDGAAGDYFGESVSIDGGTVVIGAKLDDDKGGNSGSAYVFSLPFPHCDASAPPANGAVGDCTSALESGSSCQPTCNQGYLVSGPSVCDNGVLLPAICIPLCDASSPPANGAVGDCTDQLLSGTTCQPTCDSGYFAPEPSVCENGVLLPAVCTRYCDASSPPANGGVGDCVEYMLSGTTCQPTCDALYFASGPSVCEDGVLSPAVCTPFLNIQERAKVIADDAAANRKFGGSVSIDGDTMVVGAEGASAAYVFTRNLAYDWTQVDKLTPDVAVGEFGKSVSIDGDTIVVGASGTACVFTRNSPGDLTSTWSQNAQLFSSPATGSFGIAVAIDGDTIAVGANQFTNHDSYPGEGAVYIFTRTGDLTSSWSQGVRLGFGYWMGAYASVGSSVSMYAWPLGCRCTIQAAKGEPRDGVRVHDKAQRPDSSWSFKRSMVLLQRLICFPSLTHRRNELRQERVDRPRYDGDRGVRRLWLRRPLKGWRYAEIWTRTSGCLRCCWTRRQQLDLPASGIVRLASVSRSTATVVIVTYDEDDSRGTAYVYRRDTPGDLASGWTQHQADRERRRRDGPVRWSVAIDGARW